MPKNRHTAAREARNATTTALTPIIDAQGGELFDDWAWLPQPGSGSPSPAILLHNEAGAIHAYALSSYEGSDLRADLAAMGILAATAQKASPYEAQMLQEARGDIVGSGTFGPARQARRLINASRPINRTIAARFLSKVANLRPRPDAELLFCDRIRYPHLVAPLVNFRGEVTGVQLHKLTAEANRARGPDAIRTIGVWRTGYFQLGKTHDQCVIAVGLLNAIAASAVLELPAIGAVDCDDLEALRLPKGVRYLALAPSNDPRERQAFEALAARLSAYQECDIRLLPAPRVAGTWEALAASQRPKPLTQTFEFAGLPKWGPQHAH